MASTGTVGAAAELHQTALRLRRSGDAAGARAAWLRVIAALPAHHDALVGLGELALETGDAAEAARRFAALPPPGTARVLVGLAAAQHRLGQHADALGTAQRAVQLAPGDAGALALAGALLLAAERFAEAEPMLRRASDRSAGARANLAALLLVTGRLEEALAIGREAVRQEPRQVAGWMTLGAVLLRLGRFEESCEAYRQVVALDPDNPEGHMALGMSLLRLGAFAEGWREFAWRWRSPRAAGDLRPWKLPRWDSVSAAPRLILFSEQGFGDTLQFCRYAPLLAARGHEVVLEVQPELASLLARSFADAHVRVVARAADGAPPADADAALGLLDVPGALGTTLETIPNAMRYLRSAPAKRAAWQGRLDAAAPGGFRVGVVWAGGVRDGRAAAIRAVDARRSVRLAELCALVETPGVTLVSLQKGPPAAEVRDTDIPLLDWTAELADFDDTAALADALDLIVTVDTAVAHLAGGLGKPTILLSRFDGCWRWLAEGEESPWYPTLRIIRQGADLSWREPVARAAGLVRAAARSVAEI
jgi:Flp pilus assembly protein TadD